MWTRQDDETSAAWAAFQVFRDMPPGDRSLNAAYRASKGREKGRASGTWLRWYAQYAWSERATAYDRYQDEQRRQRLEERRLRALEEQADLGELLRKKAAGAARALAAVTQQIGTHGGKEAWILAAELKPNEIARLAQVGAELERAALGEPERVEIQGAVQVQRAEIDYDQMTDAQLEAIIVAAQAFREAQEHDGTENE